MNETNDCFELGEYSLCKQIQEEPIRDFNDDFIERLNKENDKMKIKFRDGSIDIDKLNEINKLADEYFTLSKKAQNRIMSQLWKSYSFITFGKKDD